LWLPSLLAAVGVFILGRAGLEGLADVARAARGRLRRRSLLPPPAPERELRRGRENVFVLLRLRFARKGPVLWAGLGGGLLLAVLWRHPVLSPWFVALGGAVGWMLASTRPSVEREDLRALEAFIASLRSVFAVGQSVFVSLETAAQDLDEGPLRRAALEAGRRYRADLDARQALAALSEVGWPCLDRLTLVLGEVGRADGETVREALLSLEEGTHATRRLQDRAQTVLTLTRLTLRVLQAANLAALAAVTLLPLGRAFYAARPLALVAATGMALAGSWYFAGEIKRMEALL
jgi:hypothetical protein